MAKLLGFRIGSKEFAVEGDMSLTEFIRENGESTDQCTILVNGRQVAVSCTDTTRITNSDEVELAPAAKGGHTVA